VVTGLTVDRSVDLVGMPTPRPMLEVSSLDFTGSASIDLRASGTAPVGEWADYARAAVHVLSANRVLPVGMRAVVGGDLAGSGLSSSAAVLITYLMALAHVNRIDLSRDVLSALVQRAENDFMGVSSGRLDPSVILFAEPGSLTRVDCSTLAVSQIPPPDGGPAPAFLVAFSGRRRALVDSDFNRRVSECREAAARLLALGGRFVPPGAELSDVDLRCFEEFGPALPGPLRRRAAHYFGEQQRVVAGVEAWREGSFEAFGELMTASGASSIANYECGTPELVALWEALRSTPGVHGARFSGAGFGGSCVALVEPEAGAAVIEAVRRRYAAEQPLAAAASSFHLCAADGPARVMEEI
jgi:galactokinase/galacturonokinase